MLLAVVHSQAEKRTAQVGIPQRRTLAGEIGMEDQALGSRLDALGDASQNFVGIDSEALRGLALGGGKLVAIKSGGQAEVTASADLIAKGATIKLNG